MKAWENYAYIKDGTVLNVGCFSVGGYTEAQHIATTIYGDGVFAVEVTYIPCQIDDSYVNGSFYHDGKAVEPMPDEEVRLDSHDAALSEQSDAIDEIIISLLEG